MYLILLGMTLLQSVCFGLRTDFIDGWSCVTIPSHHVLGAESTGSCLVGDAHAMLLDARSGVLRVLQCRRRAFDGAVDLSVLAPELSPLVMCLHSDVPLALAIATFLGARLSEANGGGGSNLLGGKSFLGIYSYSLASDSKADSGGNFREHLEFLI